jgi:hypothetical protein
MPILWFVNPIGFVGLITVSYLCHLFNSGTDFKRGRGGPLYIHACYHVLFIFFNGSPPPLPLGSFGTVLRNLLKMEFCL